MAWTRTQKEAARAAVGKAIRDGVMTRPEVCEACGLLEGDTYANNRPVTIQWHHPCYSAAKRLDVVGLCVSCHRKVHAGSLAEPGTGRLYPVPSTRKKSPKPKTRLPVFAKLMEAGLRASNCERISDLHRELSGRGFTIARPTIDRWFAGETSPSDGDVIDALFDIFGIHGLADQRDWYRASFFRKSQCATTKQAA